MIHKALFFLSVLIGQLSFSQYISYSDTTEISVLTCGPGEELYSTFGHSAFRIKDRLNHLDIVYNYGMFDFNAPNFYTNFAKGKLIYKLGRNRFSNFYEQYQNENRAINEQVLNLDTAQKKKLITFLEHNAQPENASYQYDFFYNNCATKIRSVLEDVFPSQLQFNDSHITTSYTMRQLINNNVPYNTWANVGINIALGSVIDVNATTDEYQFLPEYIYKAFDNASINNEPLINGNSVLLKKNDAIHQNTNFLFSPILIVSSISILILLITFKDYKKKKRTKFLDFVLLFTTGIIGILVLLLWLATNHGTTANNLNILWAFPPNLVVSFFMFRKENIKWKEYYFTVLMVLIITQALVWCFKIEEFSIALTPLFIALGIRYGYISRYFKR
jgi:hypothetical protein